MHKNTSQSGTKQSKTDNPKDEAVSHEIEEVMQGDIESLRPQSIEEYVGQPHLIKQLKLIIESAKIRNATPEHMLFYGQPGLGKTTIASIISTELHAPFKVISAPALQKIGDIVSLLVNLEENCVLFIDEIHRLKAPLEETLYTAMEDKQVDLVIGKGHGATSTRIDLQPFTLIGATTQLGKLSKPLKDRFPNVFNLQPYPDNEMIELVRKNCAKLQLSLHEDSQSLVCRRARGIPRIANNILKRLLDVQIVEESSEISLKRAETFLDELGIYDRGITKTDIAYLEALADTNLSLRTLSGVLMEEVETIELVIEPYLLHLGLIDKGNDGRRITPKGEKQLAELKLHIHSLHV